MTLAIGIARYLAAQESLSLTYSATGPSEIFIERVPQDDPDVCVIVTQYAGDEADARLGYDEPRFQVRTRSAPNDPSASLALSEAIYNTLHGLDDTTLPDGTRLVECLCISSGPSSMGQDARDRFEHVLSFRTEVRNTSGGRE